MQENSDSLLSTWQSAVAEIVRLSQDPRSGIAPLTAKQRAFLQLATPVTFVPGYAVLSTPSALAKEVIETELAEAINTALYNILGTPHSLAVSVEPGTAPAPVEIPGSVAEHPENVAVSATMPVPTESAVYQSRPAEPAAPTAGPDSNRQWQGIDISLIEEMRAEHLGEETPGPRLRRDTPAQRTEQSLNPRYTFDNFVIGGSNRFPYAASVAVAESLARAYNPLFIWGGSGLGKTHLLHAIGNYAQVLQPGLRVKYVSSEEFTNDYINSVRDDRQEKFKQRYRNLDILMVDDIQFLEGKEGTQEEFFHTFNALHQADKQIVLSSDRPPKELNVLTDRLRTRFKAGLIADIQPPDLETRMAILSKKAQSDRTHVDQEVLELIASRFDTSIRELEGALIRVIAYSSLIHEPIDRRTAEIALQDIMPDSEDSEVSPALILEQTAEYFDIKLDALTGTGKTRAVAHARQIAMYLCRELTELSLPRIGDHFGGKDHTTVMYAVRKISKEISEKRDTYDQIQAITSVIKSRNRH